MIRTMVQEFLKLVSGQIVIKIKGSTQTNLTLLVLINLDIYFVI